MTNPEHEKPEADAAEQAALADPGSDESEPSPAATSIEAPEWDTWEQGRVVPLDDDDR